MQTTDVKEILEVSNKTLNNILSILSQQDFRIKQVELTNGIQPKVNKDYLVEKLEKSLETFDENITLEGLKTILEDISSYLAWNSNRILRLEKKAKGGL
jgi:uncharacterized membrane protein YheB (UPF0754 family)